MRYQYVVVRTAASLVLAVAAQAQAGPLGGLGGSLLNSTLPVSGSMTGGGSVSGAGSLTGSLAPVTATLNAQGSGTVNGALGGALGVQHPALPELSLPRPEPLITEVDGGVNYGESSGAAAVSTLSATSQTMRGRIDSAANEGLTAAGKLRSTATRTAATTQTAADAAAKVGIAATMSKAGGMVNGLGTAAADGKAALSSTAQGVSIPAYPGKARLLHRESSSIAANGSLMNSVGAGTTLQQSDHGSRSSPAMSGSASAGAEMSTKPLSASLDMSASLDGDARKQ